MTTTTCHAIRKDRALSAAQGTVLSALSGRTAVKPLMGTNAPVAFAGVDTYVANQEPPPPRGTSPA